MGKCHDCLEYDEKLRGGYIECEGCEPKKWYHNECTDETDKPNIRQCRKCSKELTQDGGNEKEDVIQDKGDAKQDGQRKEKDQPKRWGRARGRGKGRAKSGGTGRGRWVWQEPDDGQGE